MRLKVVKNWKKLLKSYSAMMHIANILQALSIAGLSVLGVVSVHMAFKAALLLAVIFGALGFVGRMIKQDNISGAEDDETPE